MFISEIAVWVCERGLLYDKRTDVNLNQWLRQF